MHKNTLCNSKSFSCFIFRNFKHLYPPKYEYSNIQCRTPQFIVAKLIITHNFQLHNRQFCDILNTVLYKVLQNRTERSLFMSYINESVIYNIYPLGWCGAQNKMTVSLFTDLTRFMIGFLILKK